MNALVLVVDDHADTREGYEAYLRFIGARVATASSAEDAIKLARDLTPDVIVMDGKLPGMSGPEAVEILRADTQTQSIPIISVSGHHGGDKQCDRSLMKPCTPDELAAAIRDVLGTAKRSRPLSD
jgi:two-component system, OmpR family, phosphate regulon response regulator PhoB